MYADNVMGIASGSQHSQDIAKSIIESVNVDASSDMSVQSRSILHQYLLK